MGLGDTLFALWIGLICGFPAAPVGIFLAFLLGGFFAIIIMVFKKGKKRGLKVAFGPFIVLGGLIAVFWGTEIVSWYLKIIGY